MHADEKPDVEVDAGRSEADPESADELPVLELKDAVGVDNASERGDSSRSAKDRAPAERSSTVAEIDRLSSELAARTGELDRAHATIGDLEQNLTAHTERLSSLESELATSNERIETLERELEQLSRRFTVADHADASRREEAIERLEHELQRQQRTCEKQMEQLGMMDSRLRFRDATIAELNARLDRRTAGVESVTETSLTEPETISAEVRHKGQELDQLRAHVAEPTGGKSRRTLWRRSLAKARQLWSRRNELSGEHSHKNNAVEAHDKDSTDNPRSVDDHGQRLRDSRKQTQRQEASQLAPQQAPAPTEPTDGQTIHELEAASQSRSREIAASAERWEVVEAAYRETIASLQDEFVAKAEHSNRLMQQLEDQRRQSSVWKRLLDEHGITAARLQDELEEPAELECSDQAAGVGQSMEERTTTRLEPAVKLLVSMDSEIELKHPLFKNCMEIGRTSDNDIQVLAKYVSRRHARILTDAATTIIEDLGSKNGVFVNGDEVRRRALRDGDVVMIGHSRFRYVDRSL